MLIKKLNILFRLTTEIMPRFYLWSTYQFTLIKKSITNKSSFSSVLLQAVLKLKKTLYFKIGSGSASTVPRAYLFYLLSYCHRLTAVSVTIIFS